MLLADATCRSLFTHLLTIGGLDSERRVPAVIVDALRELATRDGAFAECFQMQPQPVDWEDVARHLPELLIRYYGTRVGPAAPLHFSALADDSCVAQLLSLSHLVLRQQTLEISFNTELKRQKTEAIYQFAYGLSHELNNPLANIATRAGLLVSDERHPQRQQMLEMIVANAMRGCEMLGDLMLVARPPELQFASMRINELILAIVARATPWAISFQVDLQHQIDSTQSIQADAAAFTEAVWALVRNAIESMPDGGVVSIDVSDTIEQADAPRTICVEVADQGHGLSTAALEHCFDPYYSGREAGRGLGLGLAKALRIVQLHGGDLTLSNLPTGGCLARIVLPMPAEKVKPGTPLRGSRE